MYWKVDVPENFSKQRFPAFIGYLTDDRTFGYYGLPIHEYPGLVKVGKILSFP